VEFGKDEYLLQFEKAGRSMLLLSNAEAPSTVFDVSDLVRLSKHIQQLMDPSMFSGRNVRLAPQVAYLLTFNGPQETMGMEAFFPKGNSGDLKDRFRNGGWMQYEHPQNTTRIINHFFPGIGVIRLIADQKLQKMLAFDLQHESENTELWSVNTLNNSVAARCIGRDTTACRFNNSNSEFMPIYAPGQPAEDGGAVDETNGVNRLVVIHVATRKVVDFDISSITLRSQPWEVGEIVAGGSIDSLLLGVPSAEGMDIFMVKDGKPSLLTTFTALGQRGRFVITPDGATVIMVNGTSAEFWETSKELTKERISMLSKSSTKQLIGIACQAKLAVPIREKEWTDLTGLGEPVVEPC
jgi:hypothetical protein